MKTLGTILPSIESLSAADSHADRIAKQREQFGDRELQGCEKRIVGGEVRWYDTADQYAIVARSGNILWFQVTTDGDVRI